jgi:hypothetical protein
MYLPNRLELSFLKVLLLPKAYNKGLHANIFYCIMWEFIIEKLVRVYKQYFVVSVLPAPLSPEITIP